MTLRRASSQLAGATAAVLAFLALGAPPVSAQETLWKTYLEDGREAYHAARYAEAEKLLTLALAEAEQFGPSDPPPGSAVRPCTAAGRGVPLPLHELAR